MLRKDVKVGMYLLSKNNNKYKVLKIEDGKVISEVIEVNNSMVMIRPVGYITTDLAISMMEPYITKLHIPKSILNI